MILVEILSSFGAVIDVLGFIFKWWWTWLAPLSLFLAHKMWLNWRQMLFLEKQEWTVLEIRMPREIERSPKAMEQFFTSIHTLNNAPGDFLDKYKAGEIPLWFAFEIVSFGGDIHFFIRTLSKYVRIVTGNLYAHYPTIEIEEVEDYASRIPSTYSSLNRANLDVWGSELILNKPQVYPIRTYVDYEDIDEARALDPIGGLLEMAGKCGPKEQLFFQLLLRPADTKWKDEGEKEVEELKNKGRKTVQGQHGEYEDRPIRTPRETDRIKAIEEKLSKPGFHTTIRYMYLTTKDNMNGLAKEFARRTLMAAFNQHAVQDMNQFGRNHSVSTDVKWTYFPHVFPKTRLLRRKNNILKNYLGRVMNDNYIGLFKSSQRAFVLNAQEVATIYHPPTNLVLTGPMLKRVEAKHMGPPAGLPIFKDGE